MRIPGILVLDSMKSIGMNKRGLMYYPFLSIVKTDCKIYIPSSMRYSTNPYSPYNPYVLAELPDTVVSVSPSIVKGTLLAVYGSTNDPHAEELALLAKWNISNKEPYTIPQDTPDASMMRENYTDHYTVSIDPLGCKDIDDAVSMHENFIFIHIADLSSYKCDITDRVSSVYLRDRVIPLIPRTISEGSSSLLPGARRNTITCVFTEKLEFVMCKHGQIISAKAHTYESAYDDPLVKRLLMIFDTTDTHVLISKLMILYNKTTGQILKNNNCALVRTFRDKSEPAIYRWNPPEEDSWHMHSDIMSQWYAHSTSPIRRIVDIYTQQLLRKIIESGGKERSKDQERSCAPVDMVKLNEMSLRVKKFYRDLAICALSKKLYGTYEYEKITNNKIYVPDLNIYLNTCDVPLPRGRALLFADSTLPFWRRISVSFL